jgi:hypothetical protein
MPESTSRNDDRASIHTSNGMVRTSYVTCSPGATDDAVTVAPGHVSQVRREAAR